MSKWVVDTCVIIDVLSGDGVFSAKSADAIDAKRAEGLVIAPITYVELAPSFLGDVARRKNSLESVVMCYSLDENQLVSAGLRIRSFLNIEPGRLRFVVANRYFQEDTPDHNLDKRWDVVHGFIADDRIVRLLDALVKGTTTEESVLRTLQASRFKSVQYSFHSAMAVKGKFGKIQIAKPMESLGRKGTT